MPPGDDPDGSGELLSPLDGAPETYRAWAEDYYERPVDREAVARIYAHEPLTQDLVDALGPGRRIEELNEDLEEIGYPLAGGRSPVDDQGVRRSMSGEVGG